MATESRDRTHRVAVVGAGHVGATCAYTLVLSGLASEIVLVDLDRARAEGEAMDVSHAVPFGRPCRVRAGDYPDCAGAAVAVVAAGVGQEPGESRLALLQRNVEVFRSVIPQIVAHAPETVLVIATNPVDVMAYAAGRLSALPPARVIGSGTILDTARFRHLIGDHLSVDPRSVHAYIAGEHGDSEVPLWSHVRIGGVHFDDYCRRRGLDGGAEAKRSLFERTRDAAYHKGDDRGVALPLAA